jgi:hypothetical protein
MSRIPLILLFGAALLGARDKKTERDWQEGAVQFVEVKHTRHFEPLSPVTGLEIVSDNRVYRVNVLPGIHKKDLIPFAGIVTEERRRAKDTWRVAVGSIVKFSISKERGWIVDNQGRERPLKVKSVRAVSSR